MNETVRSMNVIDGFQPFADGDRYADNMIQDMNAKNTAYFILPVLLLLSERGMKKVDDFVGLWFLCNPAILYLLLAIGIFGICSIKNAPAMGAAPYPDESLKSVWQTITSTKKIETV